MPNAANNLPGALPVHTATAVHNLISRGEKIIQLNALITLVDDRAVIDALNTELQTLKKFVEETINHAIKLDSQETVGAGGVPFVRSNAFLHG
jgi:hypothetical protein